MLLGNGTTGFNTIAAGSHSVVSRNTVIGGTGDRGILAGDHSTVNDNVVNNNTVTVAGIDVGASSDVLRNTALNNGADGIDVTCPSTVKFYTALGKQTVRLRKEVPGHVANRLQAALAREVYYLVAEDVVSVADVDKALCWGPGLRWGIMGNMMLNHLGGGADGIEHFFDQFTGPMTAWWKVLGSPELTSEVRRKLIDGLHAEVGTRTVSDLEAQRDEILLGLLELRARYETPTVTAQKADRAA